MAADHARAWMRAQDRMHAGTHGRRPRKLTPAQLDDIRARRAAGETPKALAVEFGVTASLIRNYTAT